MKKTILTIRRFNNYLIHILSVIFSIKNKKLIINNLRKYSLHIIGTIFVYLLYLSLPFIFNSEIIKKELSLNIIKEYKVKLKISDNIKYSIFPSPHFKIKNSLLFINDNENEIAKIKETKIFISTLNLHNSKKIKISKVVFNESNFILKKKKFKIY